MSTQHFTCPVTGKQYPINQAVPVSSLRNSLFEMLREQNPNISLNDKISTEALDELRLRHVQSMLESDKGDLNRLEQEVLERMNRDELLSKNINDVFDDQLTFGQRLADRIATFGGSWRFIIYFGMFIAVWMILNSFFLMSKAYDPYPFILLNLILSCLAALQAPVIMMSQNRMEEKDRQRAANDYQVNLKAELEIRQLHEKMDHLITKQVQHLNEIQQIQLDLLNEIARNNKK